MLHAIVNHDGDSFIHKARDLGMPNLLSMSVVGGSTFVAQTMIRSTLRLEGYSVDTFNVYPVRLGFRKAVANLTGGTLEYVTIKDIQAISWTRRRRRLQSGGEVEDPSRRRLASGVDVTYEVDVETHAPTYVQPFAFIPLEPYLKVHFVSSSLPPPQVCPNNLLRCGYFDFCQTIRCERDEGERPASSSLAGRARRRRDARRPRDDNCRTAACCCHHRL